MNAELVTFKEFKEQGIVKAIIYDCQWDAVEKIRVCIMQPATSHMTIDPMWKSDYMMRKSYSAIAKCAPGDTYDFEVGKTIALNKLSEKYNKAINRRVALFVKHMTKAIECANTFLAKQKYSEK